MCTCMSGKNCLSKILEIEFIANLLLLGVCDLCQHLSDRNW